MKYVKYKSIRTCIIHTSKHCIVRIYPTTGFKIKHGLPLQGCFISNHKNRQKACETWKSEWLSLLYTVTVVQGSISSEIGQHLSREHLLLAAQGNCTFTTSWSSFKETET